MPVFICRYQLLNNPTHTIALLALLQLLALLEITLLIILSAALITRSRHLTPNDRLDAGGDGAGGRFLQRG
jgi:hypothetical protein